MPVIIFILETPFSIICLLLATMRIIWFATSATWCYRPQLPLWFIWEAFWIYQCRGLSHVNFSLRSLLFLSYHDKRLFYAVLADICRFNGRTWLLAEYVLDCLVEKASDVLYELVWVVQKGRMVGALEDKYLRQALLVELVPLNNLISSVRAKPVLVTIAESYREGQVWVAKSVILC